VAVKTQPQDLQRELSKPGIEYLSPHKHLDKSSELIQLDKSNKLDDLSDF
jgi:hypothetical protein